MLLLQEARRQEFWEVLFEKDDMTPLYEKLENADAIFLGSPIYFGTVSSGTKMFIERLFPSFTYKEYSILFPERYMSD